MSRSMLVPGCIVVAAMLGLLRSAEAQQPPATPPAAPSPPAAPPPPPPSETVPAADSGSAPAQAANAPDTGASAVVPAQQYVLVPVDQYKPAKPRQPRRSRGLMITGFILFGVGYVPPAFIGGLIGSMDRDVCDCQDAFRMFIPIVGPLTLLDDEDEDAALNALLVSDAIVQSAGLVLSILGIIRYSASGREEAAAREAPQLGFDLLPTPDGARATLTLRL